MPPAPFRPVALPLADGCSVRSAVSTVDSLLSHAHTFTLARSTDFPATANPRPFDELSKDLKAQQVFKPCLFMFLLFGLLLHAFRS